MRASGNQAGYSVAYFSLVGFSSAAKACTVEINPAAIRAARLFTCETEYGDLVDAQTRLKGACPVRDTPGARSSCARPVTCDIEMSPSVAWYTSLNELRSRLAHNSCALEPGIHNLCQCLRDKDYRLTKEWFRSALSVMYLNYHPAQADPLAHSTPWRQDTPKNSVAWEVTYAHNNNLRLIDCKNPCKLCIRSSCIP